MHYTRITLFRLCENECGQFKSGLQYECVLSSSFCLAPCENCEGHTNYHNDRNEPQGTPTTDPGISVLTPSLPQSVDVICHSSTGFTAVNGD